MFRSQGLLASSSHQESEDDFFELADDRALYPSDQERNRCCYKRDQSGVAVVRNIPRIHPSNPRLAVFGCQSSGLARVFESGRAAPGLRLGLRL